MSQERARVGSIAVIDQFRVTLAEFVDTGRNALVEADGELLRTIQWLERERIPHWIRQIRRREELVTRAKSELFRKQVPLSSKDRKPSATVEQINLRRAITHLEEAQGRLEATRQWIRRLERERTLYRASVSAFGTAVEVDLPHAVAMLRRMSENLEAYLSLSPMDLTRALASPAESVESTRRTGTSSSTDKSEEGHRMDEGDEESSS